MAAERKPAAGAKRCRLGAARRWLLALVCTLPLLAAAQPAPRPDGGAMRVLILHGVDPWLPAMVEQDRALRLALRRDTGDRVADIYSEIIDNGRFNGADVELAFLGLLRQKYQGTRIDLIIAVGAFGLDFAEKHQATLWPGTPIVFYAVAPEQLAARTLSPVTTGVTAWLDPAGTMTIVRRLQPGVSELVVTGGVAPTDKVRVQRVIDSARREHPDLRVTRLDDRPLPELLKHLATLPDSAAVYYAGMFRDAGGESYVPAEIAERISSASAVPVYSNFGSFMGRGIVGGQLNDYAAEGERAGQLAAGVLTGKVAAGAPVVEPNISACSVDARQMARWSLPASRLPPGCSVLFEPHSLWLKHRWELLIGLALIIVQGVLILMLVRQRARARAADLQAQEAHAGLAHAARLATVGELTAAISHEINQPLGAVQSNADAAEMLLENDEPPLDRVRQILAEIRAANLRASEVVQRLRQLLLKERPRSEEVDLASVVDGVVQIVGGEAKRRAVTITTEIAARPLTVVGDSVQLQQVLINLLMNAMDAVAESGPERPRVWVKATRDGGGHALLEVGDTGCGIPPPELPLLFKSFHSTKKGGMGLGLSISRSIVMAHGGRIEAANNAAGGATFTVRLPVAHSRWYATPREEPVRTLAPAEEA